VVATVGLGASPKALCYDSGKGEIFVPCVGGDGPIKVISDSNNTVVATILLPETIFSREPWAACYVPNKNEIFVSNHDNTVSIISDTNNTVIATFAVGNSPYGFAYDSAKGLMFVAAGQIHISASEYYDTVQVISVSNNTVIENISVGTQPKCLEYVPAMGKIFVTNSYVNTVSVISDSPSVPNTTPGNNNNNGGQQNNNNAPGNKSTPGFELLIVIGAAAIVLFLKRKR
jgi:YVTN family beta-propeller protein